MMQQTRKQKLTSTSSSLTHMEPAPLQCRGGHFSRHILTTRSRVDSIATALGVSTLGCSSRRLLTSWQQWTIADGLLCCVPFRSSSSSSSSASSYNLQSTWRKYAYRSKFIAASRGFPAIARLSYFLFIFISPPLENSDSTKTQNRTFTVNSTHITTQALYSCIVL